MHSKDKFPDYSESIPSIIVVEDDVGLNRLIQKTLQREGFEVTGVTSGSMAIGALSGKTGSLLLLDYILSDMTAEDLIMTLSKKGPVIPFITMTGHGDEKIAVKMMKLGARDYIIKDKGFLDLLIPVIRNALNKLCMEQKLAEIQNTLRESEEKYRCLFENSPISLWEEDLSEVKGFIDNLRDSGVTDFMQYFSEKPEVVAECASMVKVIDINRITMKLYKAGSKKEFRSGISKVVTKESYPYLRNALAAIANGKTEFESETVNQTLEGEKKYVNIKWSVAPGYEETFSKVLVSIMDMTERKNMEKTLIEMEERERRNIGYELHDGIGQLLTGISFKTRSLGRKIEDKFKEGSEEAAEISSLIDQAKKQVSRLLKGLSPFEIDNEGLVAALKMLVSYSETIFGIPCVFRYDNSVNVTNTMVVSQLYRIAQEAITNAVQHAHPKSIEISLKKMGDRLLMSVKDDGEGIAENTGRLKGMGLKIMQHRAEIINASLDVHPNNSKGTIVACIFQDLPAEKNW